MKKGKNIPEELESFSWQNLNQLIKKGNFKATKRPLSKDTYLFIANDKNYETVIQLIFTSLQKIDPEHANLEDAIKIAGEAQIFAKTMIEKIDKEQSTE